MPTRRPHRRSTTDTPLRVRVLGALQADRLRHVPANGKERPAGPARDPEDPEFFGKWADLAHSAQVVYEEIFFHVLRDLEQRTGLKKLSLAGGCALNSVANVLNIMRIMANFASGALTAHAAGNADAAVHNQFGVA